MMFLQKVIIQRCSDTPIWRAPVGLGANLTLTDIISELIETKLQNIEFPPVNGKISRIGILYKSINPIVSKINPKIKKDN